MRKFYETTVKLPDSLFLIFYFDFPEIPANQEP